MKGVSEGHAPYEFLQNPSSPIRRHLWPDSSMLQKSHRAVLPVTCDIVLRHGVLPEEPEAVANEYQVESIVLGKPAEGGVYSLEELDAFAAELEAKTGSQVLII